MTKGCAAMEIIKDISNIEKIENNSLILGDCLDVMPKIKEHSVYLILCDLPYGRTQNKWDAIIPFEKLWNNYNRLYRYAQGRKYRRNRKTKKWL